MFRGIPKASAPTCSFHNIPVNSLKQSPRVAPRGTGRDGKRTSLSTLSTGPSD